MVIIASDGLDVRAGLGEAWVTSPTAALVWLNPLLETPGYEPTARGMRAARPYITTLASVTDAASFA